MTVRAEIRPIPEPPREVVISMDYDTAQTVLEALGLISGGDATFAKHTDGVCEALLDAGLSYNYTRDVPDRFTGSLRGLPL